MEMESANGYGSAVCKNSYIYWDALQNSRDRRTERQHCIVLNGFARQAGLSVVSFLIMVQDLRKHQLVGFQ